MTASDGLLRGDPIPDSQFFREFCYECNDPIRVVYDDVGSGRRCDVCECLLVSGT